MYGGTSVYVAAGNLWKVEGEAVTPISVSDAKGIYALCAAGSDLYAAGFYEDTDSKYKPVWWHIAKDLTVTEHKLGTAQGSVRGICVAPQE